MLLDWESPKILSDISRSKTQAQNQEQSQTLRLSGHQSRESSSSYGLACVKVLLVRRGKEPEKGMLTFPGGSLELGETMAECAARELMEETGLKLLNQPPGGPWNCMTFITHPRCTDNAICLTTIALQILL